jgi:hypothetical protein
VSGVTLEPSKDEEFTRQTYGAALRRLGYEHPEGCFSWGIRMEDSPLDVDPYDLVFSHTVLEHVKDAEMFIQRAWERTSGAFISYVDLSDHGVTGKGPLGHLIDDAWKDEQLKYLDRTGNLIFSFERLSHYENLMRKTGGSVKTLVVSTFSDVPGSLRKRMSPRDAEVESAYIIVRRV